jgi:hypothetical protein
MRRKPVTARPLLRRRNRRRRDLSCVNLKGGVGQTAIAVNFAAHRGIHGFSFIGFGTDRVGTV